MAGTGALHSQPGSLDFINLLRLKSAAFKVTFSVGCKDEIVPAAHNGFQVLHDLCGLILSAVVWWMSLLQKAHFTSSEGQRAPIPCSRHRRPYLSLKSPNKSSNAWLSAKRCSPSVMDRPLLAPIKMASAFWIFSATGLRSYIPNLPFRTCVLPHPVRLRQYPL